MTRRSSSVTIRDVAREAGVSVATISRYINRSAPVSDKAAKRIGLAISELNYIPQAAARQLATLQTKVIGLLLPNLHHDFFAPLISGIEAVVQEEGYNLLVATNHTGTRYDSHFPIGPHNTDGMIVFEDSLGDSDILNLQQRGFSIVLIYCSSPECSTIPCIKIENKNATFQLLEHLISVHGKRKILLVRGSVHQEDSRLRENGYLQALIKYGIQPNPELIINGEFQRGIAYQAMKEFLEKKIDFDAVFSSNDDSAIGVMKALQESGYHVPKDISITGFDDLQISAFLTPPLTTVRAPTELVGRTAAKQLFDLLIGKDVDLVTLLPTEIVIRRSCGCYA